MQNVTETLLAYHLSFSFLSKVFYEPPSAEFVQRLVDDALFEDWPVESDNADIQAGLAELRAFCASWQPDHLSALKRDYARLFIGPDHLLAVPWESVYRNEERLLFDQHTLQVRAYYQRFGMEIPRLNVEPDDHIGLEFRFVAFLCGLGLEALEQDRPDLVAGLQDVLTAFFNEHLLVWSGECLGNVRAHAQTAYYRGVAQLALGCLQVSPAALATSVEAPMA